MTTETSQQPTYTASGCRNAECICHTPGRVCPEYLEDYADISCARCGWNNAAHKVTP